MLQTDFFNNDIITEIENDVNCPIYRTLNKAENFVLNTQDMREKMYQHYKMIGKPMQAQAVRQCGTFLMFRQFHDKNSTAQLSRANFCKNPLCPMCAWRRHIKYSNIMSYALQHTRGKLSHLVLGVPNTEHITRDRLMYLKERGKSFIQQKLGVKSYVSNLEITASERGFHPHLHILIDTDEYFNVSEESIKKFAQLWKYHFAKRDTAIYTREYDGYTYYIRGFKKSNPDEMSHIIMETTKYILKSEVSVTEELVSEMLEAIHGVRKMSAGGEFKGAIRQGKIETIVATEERLRQLYEYDWEWQIYNFINGRYIKK